VARYQLLPTEVKVAVALNAPCRTGVPDIVNVAECATGSTPVVDSFTIVKYVDVPYLTYTDTVYVPGKIPGVILYIAEYARFAVNRNAVVPPFGSVCPDVIVEDPALIQIEFDRSLGT